MVNFYNDTRKFCPGCKVQRSIRQFASKEARYCNKCLLRGDDKKPESATTVDRTYQVNRSLT